MRVYICPRVSHEVSDNLAVTILSLREQGSHSVTYAVLYIRLAFLHQEFEELKLIVLSDSSSSISI